MLDHLTKPYTGPTYPLQTVLELACAAQRFNKDYIKMLEAVVDEPSGKLMYYKHTNKSLMLVALGEDKTNYAHDPMLQPNLITTNLDDKELATEIQQYFRKLMFAAIEGENEFQVEVNSLLNSAEVPLNKLGFIACLPSVYKRDYARSQTVKRVKNLDEGYLADIGTNLLDLDCEVLDSKRSKNFDAWNIDAIINNRMVSWFSKVDLKPGPCVVVKAKVKDHSTHWKHQVPVTRLNYVKAAQ